MQGDPFFIINIPSSRCANRSGWKPGKPITKRSALHWPSLGCDSSYGQPLTTVLMLKGGWPEMGLVGVEGNREGNRYLGDLRGCVESLSVLFICRIFLFLAIISFIPSMCFPRGIPGWHRWSLRYWKTIISVFNRFGSRITYPSGM